MPAFKIRLSKCFFAVAVVGVVAKDFAVQTVRPRGGSGAVMMRVKRLVVVVFVVVAGAHRLSGTILRIVEIELEEGGGGRGRKEIVLTRRLDRYRRVDGC